LSKECVTLLENGIWKPDQVVINQIANGEDVEKKRGRRDKNLIDQKWYQFVESVKAKGGKKNSLCWKNNPSYRIQELKK